MLHQTDLSTLPTHSQVYHACLLTLLQVRILRKKLQQIEHLEQRSSYQLPLDTQQRAKVTQKSALTAALAALEGGAPLSEAQRLLLGRGLASAGSTVSVARSGSGEKPTGGKSRQAGSSGSRPAEALPTTEEGGLSAERPMSGPVPGQAGQGSMAEAAAGPSGQQQVTAALPMSGSLAPAPLAPAWAASHAQAAGGGSQTGTSQADGAGGTPVPTPATPASRSLLSAALAPKTSSSSAGPGQQQGWQDLLAAAKSPAALATAAGPGSGKKAKPGLRRGGLSMFLSGVPSSSRRVTAL